jgi:dihydroorotate dehydrogenase
MIYSSIIKPILFRKDAESAHDWAINMSSWANDSNLLSALVETLYNSENFGLEKKLWGLTFPNPIGLAAGFDKNGVTPKAMQALGFGFVEIGSITAKMSRGNPKPRAFRLPDDQSLINRMGLNNQGAEQIINRLKGYRLNIPLGVNIAKTNDMNIHGEAAIEDYKFSYDLARTVADYITINISCPNTGEGKTFEDPDALEALLKGLKLSENEVPSLVKFSVDTEKKNLEKLVELCEKFGVDGYVATNTSSKRDFLKTDINLIQRIGNGGLSGGAIATKSTQIVAWLNEFLNGSKPIVGVGGIDSLQAAIDKLNAGADLIQIYTGMVYKGPGLVKEIKKGLQKELSR